MTWHFYNTVTPNSRPEEWTQHDKANGSNSSPNQRQLRIKLLVNVISFLNSELLTLLFCYSINLFFYYVHHTGPSCSVKRGIPTSVTCTMKRASTCCAKDRRSCCCQKEHFHRDWPDPRGTSSVVQSVCRYRRTEEEHPAGCTANSPKAGVFFSEVTFSVRLTFVDICVCLLPDDAELDGRQTGGRPVWEGQCQRHWQSQQHLHALCCCRGHEDMCGGERKRVEPCPPLSGWAVSGDLLFGSANRVSSSKTCLTISDQFLHQQCLFCVWWLSHLSGPSSFACEAFTVLAQIDFLNWREMKQNVASCCFCLQLSM